YVLGQFLALFITSASGLGLLLMVTMYPVLIGLGVSPLSAVAVIGTTQSLDIGPGSGNSVLAANSAGMDIATYFAHYQIPVGLCIVFVVAILHYLTQSYFDRRAGHEAVVTQIFDEATMQDLPPKFYALLPCIPLVLILTFSKLAIKSVKMDVITAMLMATAMAMLCEYVRKGNLKEVFSSLQVFFNGMGVQFATVITLIVAGETFANGLKSIGAINTLIMGAQSLGLGVGFMIIVMTLIISASAIVMGSGNAPFFAFSALVPDVASKVGVSAVSMLLPMQFASSIARSVSPITAVIVAVSGAANVSPFDAIKRTMIPMAGALLVNIIASFIFC
ncbi:MAG: C4-dicarboxylate transporter DcuC, partial [Acidaminococcaceae bacterium]